MYWSSNYFYYYYFNLFHTKICAGNLSMLPVYKGNSLYSWHDRIHSHLPIRVQRFFYVIKIFFMLFFCFFNTDFLTKTKPQSKPTERMGGGEKRAYWVAA